MDCLSCCTGVLSTDLLGRLSASEACASNARCYDTMLGCSTTAGNTYFQGTFTRFLRCKVARISA
eukprot:6205634-Pleurochrysis_carterae.AAC.4